MKKKTNRLFSILLTLAMVITMVPAMGITAAAETTTGIVGGYAVALPEGITLPEGVGSETTVTAVTDQTGWTTGWYVVNADVSFSEGITVTGNVKLILVDNKTLTLNSGDITVTGSEDSLTVYAGNVSGNTVEGTGEIKGYLTGTGTVNLFGNVKIQAPEGITNDNGGLKANGETLNVNVADGIVLNANTFAIGSGKKTAMTAHNTTIHGTEYAEIFNAQSGGVIQINKEGDAQNLKIISERNNNQGLTAYVNSALNVYGLECLKVTRTTPNRGVNAVWASSGGDVIINTIGDLLKTDIFAKNGPADENSGENASAMALYSTWYTGSGDSKKCATLNAHGIRNITAESSGLYGAAYAVYETYGSTLNVNTPGNATEGTISANSEYLAVGVTAAGGSVGIYGMKDINALATGNDARSVKGQAVGLEVYEETRYGAPNSKGNLTINSEGSAHDTSISAKSTSAYGSGFAWNADAFAMGISSEDEAALTLYGIKDIMSEAKGSAIGIFSTNETTSDTVNKIDIDMAGLLSANTTENSGSSCGIDSAHKSEVTIEGNGTAEIKATASGSSSKAYGVSASAGATVTLNHLKSISAEGDGENYSVYAADSTVNISGKDGENKTAVNGDVSVGTEGTLHLKNTVITAQNVSNEGLITFDMTDETAARVKLIDYTGTGTPVYGTAGTNYRFADGKANGYKFEIDAQDLYAVKTSGGGGSSGGGGGVVKPAADKVTLTFDANGGNGPDVLKADKDTDVNLDAYTAEREGYTFEGWYADSALTEAVTTVKMDKDKTVYAKWTPDIPLNTTEHYAYIFGFEDGTLRPKANLTRAQAVTMLYRLLKPECRDDIFTVENDFTDVSVTQWYNKAVSSMAKGKYVEGYANATFAADRRITRAEFVTMMVRLLPEPEAVAGSTDFTDVMESNWAYKSIVQAVGAGWVDGYEDGTFRPGAEITRTEAVTILNRILQRGTDKNGLLSGAKAFSDLYETDWYYYEMMEASNGHTYTGTRPNEKWTGLGLTDKTYDIAKYERP